MKVINKDQFLEIDQNKVVSNKYVLHNIFIKRCQKTYTAK